MTRARRTPGAPIFGFLCFLLVTWCVAIIIQRLGPAESIVAPVNLLEDAAAFLLPPATTHIAISVAVEGRRSAFANAVLAAGYTLAILAIAQAALDPAHPIQFTPPAFSPLGIPAPVVAWAFAIARLAIWSAGIGYLVAGLRQAGADRARRRQLAFATLTVVLGVIGGMLRIVPEELGGPRWVGVSLIAIATVLATYAVVAQHVFLAPEVAGRAVRWSLVAGLGVVVYVATLVLLEEATARLLGIDFPIITPLALVVTLALFEPISDLLRTRTAASPRAAARDRLLGALGMGSMPRQEPDVALGPALDRLVRTFEITGAELIVDGAPAASSGTVDPDDPLAVRLMLTHGDVPLGHAVFGRKQSGLSFTPSDLEALELAVSYLGSGLRLAERGEEQAAALQQLRAERAVHQSRGTALSEALADAATPPQGLQVYALGSLRAELDGEPVRRWGGEKAGSRQAEAIFAFLFDRGERGVAKDEILELVWPDVDLARADVAFHRTMLGLRSVLRPARRQRGAEGVISFANDRYRLEPSVVAWSDVDNFERLVAESIDAEPDAAVRLLEQARALYRGDYLDDCPFYGDSAPVEDRRTDLRQRYVDVLVELGEHYAGRGNRTAAAACLRQAQSTADEDLPRVTEALGRLTLPAVADSA